MSLLEQLDPAVALLVLVCFVIVAWMAWDRHQYQQVMSKMALAQEESAKALAVLLDRVPRS